MLLSYCGRTNNLGQETLGGSAAVGRPLQEIPMRRAGLETGWSTFSKEGRVVELIGIPLEVVEFDKALLIRKVTVEAILPGR